jgi:hypothetical protein
LPTSKQAIARSGGHPGFDEGLRPVAATVIYAIDRHETSRVLLRRETWDDR